MRYLVLAVVLLLFVACMPRPAASDRAVLPPSPDETALFALHSAFWVNLHHFLYVTAMARKGYHADRQAVTDALADTVGVGALPAEDRRAWEDAVAYYDRTFSERSVIFDSAVVAVKTRLVRAGDAPTLDDAGLDPALRAVLEAAAPIYRSLWWPHHDAANRGWIERMHPLLARHGDAIAAGVTRAFRTAWPADPIRVDASPYTNRSGAYTTVRPSHIMMSSRAEGFQGTLGLEMLFHEALHTMDGAVDDARRARQAATGAELAYDLVHAILFYTAGEVTRQEVPDHIPYIEAQGLLEGRRMSQYFPPIRRHWQPYLDGNVDFEEAFAAVAAAVE